MLGTYLFSTVLCSHFLKNECCAYFWNGKNYLAEFPLYQMAFRDQRGVDLYLSPGFPLHEYRVLFESVSLPELRELNRLKEFIAAGLGRWGLKRRHLCFWGEPLLVSGTTRMTLILKKMVTLVAPWGSSLAIPSTLRLAWQSLRVCWNGFLGTTPGCWFSRSGLSRELAS